MDEDKDKICNYNILTDTWDITIKADKIEYTTCGAVAFFIKDSLIAAFAPGKWESVMLNEKE